jgi:acyl-CoA synthetase (NDP forming)
MIEMNAQAPELIIQPVVPSGLEMLVGSSYDLIFGSVVVCGAGGSLIEIIKDVSVAISPVTDVDVDEMVSSLKIHRILSGENYDLKALKDVVHRVSSLVQDVPELVEIDLNPLFVFKYGEGIIVVDARMRVDRVGPPLPLGAKKR